MGSDGPRCPTRWRRHGCRVIESVSRIASRVACFCGNVQLNDPPPREVVKHPKPALRLHDGSLSDWLERQAQKPVCSGIKSCAQPATTQQEATDMGSYMKSPRAGPTASQKRCLALAATCSCSHPLICSASLFLSTSPIVSLLSSVCLFKKRRGRSGEAVA